MREINSINIEKKQLVIQDAIGTNLPINIQNLKSVSSIAKYVTVDKIFASKLYDCFYENEESHIIDIEGKQYLISNKEFFNSFREL